MNRLLLHQKILWEEVAAIMKGCMEEAYQAILGDE
jgi:hypothetical protein